MKFAEKKIYILFSRSMRAVFLKYSIPNTIMVSSINKRTMIKITVKYDPLLMFSTSGPHNGFEMKQWWFTLILVHSGSVLKNVLKISIILFWFVCFFFYGKIYSHSYNSVTLKWSFGHPAENSSQLSAISVPFDMTTQFSVH